MKKRTAANLARKIKNPTPSPDTDAPKSSSKEQPSSKPPSKPTTRKPLRAIRRSIFRRRISIPAKTICIIGDTPAATLTAQFLDSILRVNDHTTALITSTELGASLSEDAELRRFLTQAKRTAPDFTIIEITPELARHIEGRLTPHMAVLTSLVTARDDSDSLLVKSQMQLFENEPDFIVLNHDDAWFDLFDEFIAANLKLSYGSHPVANIAITKTKLYKKGTESILTLDNKEKLTVATYSTDPDAISAMAASAAAASLLDVDPPEIQEGIASFEL